MVLTMGSTIEDKIGCLDFSLHPLRPALSGSRIVLVDQGINPVLAQTIGEGQHPVLVLRGVVAVAEEDLGGNSRFQNWLILSCGLQSTALLFW
jgi:hypothetical protein